MCVSLMPRIYLCPSPTLSSCLSLSLSLASLSISFLTTWFYSFLYPTFPFSIFVLVHLLFFTVRPSLQFKGKTPPLVASLHKLNWTLQLLLFVEKMLSGRKEVRERDQPERAQPPMSESSSTEWDKKDWEIQVDINIMLMWQLRTEVTRWTTAKF